MVVPSVDLGFHHAVSPTTGVSGPPRVTALAQNLPNPFNPSTTIYFGLKGPSDVSLRIYDVAGRRVRILVDGVQAAGVHSVRWDGRDAGGRPVASGVYFTRLAIGDEQAVGKLMVGR